MSMTQQPLFNAYFLKAFVYKIGINKRVALALRTQYRIKHNK